MAVLANGHDQPHKPQFDMDNDGVLSSGEIVEALTSRGVEKISKEQVSWSSQMKAYGVIGTVQWVHMAIFIRGRLPVSGPGSFQCILPSII